MALPALKFKKEMSLEERVARLEATVENIKRDVADVIIDIRRLNDKIDRVMDLVRFADQHLKFVRQR